MTARPAVGLRRRRRHRQQTIPAPSAASIALDLAAQPAQATVDHSSCSIWFSVSSARCVRVLPAVVASSRARGCPGSAVTVWLCRLCPVVDSWLTPVRPSDGSDVKMQDERKLNGMVTCERAPTLCYRTVGFKWAARHPSLGTADAPAAENVPRARRGRDS